MCSPGRSVMRRPAGFRRPPHRMRSENVLDIQFAYSLIVRQQPQNLACRPRRALAQRKIQTQLFGKYRVVSNRRHLDQRKLRKRRGDDHDIIRRMSQREQGVSDLIVRYSPFPGVRRVQVVNAQSIKRQPLYTGRGEDPEPSNPRFNEETMLMSESGKEATSLLLTRQIAVSKQDP